ncbi:MAG: nitrate/nitrite transporter NrtS [Acidimicrobiales bacterium]
MEATVPRTTPRLRWAVPRERPGRKEPPSDTSVTPDGLFSVGAHRARWLRCVTHRPNLARTLSIAALVGTIYFALNQLSTLIQGEAGVGVWVAIGVDYLLPFSVSNVGLLIGSRRR